MALFVTLSFLALFTATATSFELPQVLAECGWWTTYLVCVHKTNGNNKENLIWHDQNNTTILEKNFISNQTHIKSYIKARQNHNYICVFVNSTGGQLSSEVFAVPFDNSRFYLIYSVMVTTFVILSILVILCIAVLANPQHPFRRRPQTPSAEMIEVNFINLESPTEDDGFFSNKISRRHSMEI
nr:ORF130 [Acipenserid herpesvirus 1]